LDGLYKILQKAKPVILLRWSNVEQARQTRLTRADAPNLAVVLYAKLMDGLLPMDLMQRVQRIMFQGNVQVIHANKVVKTNLRFCIT
jgi:hypothetical protein